MLRSEHEEEDDWLLAWNEMLEKYNLRDNKWLKKLYDVKEKWALVYGRHTFTANMMTTQCSESMNNTLKKYLKPSHDLLRFFEHYKRVLTDRRYEELIANFKMMRTFPVLYGNVEILQHAEEVYTPKVFKLFQQQYTSIGDYVANKVSKSDMKYKYKVSYHGIAREHLVNFDALLQTITCSCIKFSFVGILCRHALKVLDKKNVRRILSFYILNRWRKEAKARNIINYQEAKTSVNLKKSVGKHYNHLCRNYREIASVAAEHEELTKYAHEHSIELLKNLEEKKKNF